MKKEAARKQTSKVSPLEMARKLVADHVEAMIDFTSDASVSTLITSRDYAELEYALKAEEGVPAGAECTETRAYERAAFLVGFQLGQQMGGRQ